MSDPFLMDASDHFRGGFPVIVGRYHAHRVAESRVIDVLNNGNHVTPLQEVANLSAHRSADVATGFAVVHRLPPQRGTVVALKNLRIAIETIGAARVILITALV